MSEPSNHFNTFKFALVVKCKQMQTTNTYSSDFSKIDFSCEFKKLQLRTLQRNLLWTLHSWEHIYEVKWLALYLKFKKAIYTFYLVLADCLLFPMILVTKTTDILLLLVNSVTVFDSERNISDILLNACVHNSSILMHVLITFLEQVESSGFSLMGFC